MCSFVCVCVCVCVYARNLMKIARQKVGPIHDDVGPTWLDGERVLHVELNKSDYLRQYSTFESIVMKLENKSTCLPSYPGVHAEIMIV